MDGLRAVMAATRSEAEGTKRKFGKYRRRGDVERAEIAARLAAEEAERAAAEERKRKLREEAAQEQREVRAEAERVRKRLRGEDAAAGDEEAAADGGDAAEPDGDTVALSVEQVKMRLRELGEPVTYFAETARARLGRLKKAEQDAKQRRELRFGQRNLFNDIMEKQELGEEGAEGVAEAAEAVNDQYDVPQDPADAATAEHKVISFLLQGLADWERFFESQPEADRTSAAGRRLRATITQSRLLLQPLLKALWKDVCPDEITNALSKVVDAALERNYVAANSAYLGLSIGNQAWPIGATMVGIHARKARERIAADKIAHVLNDETQRLYLQTVRRLLKVRQSLYPSDDPSKMMG